MKISSALSVVTFAMLGLVVTGCATEAEEEVAVEEEGAEPDETGASESAVTPGACASSSPSRVDRSYTRTGCTLTFRGSYTRSGDCEAAPLKALFRRGSTTLASGEAPHGKTAKVKWTTPARTGEQICVEFITRTTQHNWSNQTVCGGC